MPRQDGRIEPGQPLDGAISARAWNRAMDATDIVMGDNIGAVRGQRTVFGIQRVMVRIRSTSTFVTSGDLPLKPGQGFPLPMGVLMSKATNAPSGMAASEEDLPHFETVDTPVYTISDEVSYFYASNRAGIIEKVADDGMESNYKVVTVIASGIVRCRMLVLNDGACALPPPPYPNSTSLRPYWRRYLTTGEYGYGTILAKGAKYFLRGQLDYPHVAECLVHLG